MFKKLIFASLIAMAFGKQHSAHKHHNHHPKTITKTITQTVTETQTSQNTGVIGSPIMYITKTVSDCQPTDVYTTEDVPTDVTDITTESTDSQTECLSYFNKFRASQNLPPLKRASDENIKCANQAAVNDAQKGYHNSFYSQMCPYARTQNECMNGVNGGGLKNCIDAYISEGPPGTQGAYPEQNHGHWIAMTGNWQYVACGTDGNGFFTHNFY